MSTSPLRCAVIVPLLEPHVAGEPSYRVLWANGDEAEARKVAAAWAIENPGHEAHVFVRDDTARAVARVEWTKP